MMPGTETIEKKQEKGASPHSIQLTLYPQYEYEYHWKKHVVDQKKVVEHYIQPLGSKRDPWLVGHSRLNSLVKIINLILYLHLESLLTRTTFHDLYLLFLVVATFFTITLLLLLCMYSELSYVIKCKKAKEKKKKEKRFSRKLTGSFTKEEKKEAGFLNYTSLEFRQ